MFFKNFGFLIFLVNSTVVSVLLSASVARCFVSRMQDFFFTKVTKKLMKNCVYFLGVIFAGPKGGQPCRGFLILFGQLVGLSVRDCYLVCRLVGPRLSIG